MTVEEHKNNDEAEIKRVIEGYVEALRAKDLEGVMSIYAPEIVTSVLKKAYTDDFHLVYDLHLAQILMNTCEMMRLLRVLQQVGTFLGLSRT